MTTDRFREYLFAEHDEATIGRWASQLSFFRFCRAYGGHANDGDRFLAVLQYLDENQYVLLLETLELPAKSHDPAGKKPTTNQSSSADQIGQSNFRMKDMPHREQIGWCEINDCRCFAWASLGRLCLSVSGANGDAYRVSETDFENAKVIETRLGELSETVVDPPQDDRNCICPKFYAGYFDRDA